MKFTLIDRVIELVRGERIVAVKAVTLAEEYLADHFPTFPVLPGVLMLQAMAEAGAWLVQDAQDFASSIILLREAKNVTYKSFVKPGSLLQVEVTCRRLAQGESGFTGVGVCNQKEVVRAGFALTHFSLSRPGEPMNPADQRLIADARAAWAQLYPACTAQGARSAQVF